MMVTTGYYKILFVGAPGEIRTPDPLVRNLKTLVEALRQCCGENGVNPDYLLQYLTKTRIFKDFSFGQVADEPTDEEFLSQIKEAF